MKTTFLRTALLLSLIGLFLVGCGTTPPAENTLAAQPNVSATDERVLTPQPTPTPLGTEDPDEGLIFDSLTLTRSGGLADEDLTITVVGSNGAVLRDGVVVGSIPQEVVTDLDNHLDRMGFFRLEARYGPSAPRPDTYSYEITMQRNGASMTVTTMDGFVPESLQTLIQVLLTLDTSGPIPEPTTDPFAPPPTAAS